MQKNWVRNRISFDEFFFLFLEPEQADEDDDIPYNPKNLPLGWDGKPIPYWLYKLHGLNISYNCEICGNFTYKGPKAFQRHFAEWRHAHGEYWAQRFFLKWDFDSKLERKKFLNNIFKNNFSIC